MRSVARYRNTLPPLSVSLLLFVALAATGVRGLRDVSIDVPYAVAVGATVNMTCRYDLQTEDLYSVKWYKGLEFYRYVPKELPPSQVFGPLETRVDISRSDANHVVIMDMQANDTGRYRCEVSTESPAFNTIVVAGYLHVASLPTGDPEVRVEKLRYAVGDVVRGNCTVPPGNPPANVTWTVHGIPVNASYIMNVSDKFIANHYMVIAGLDFEIIPDSFSNGRLHVVCHASVFHLYQKQADVVLIEERPRLASVLGTRESSYIGNAARLVGEWLYVVGALMLLLYNLR